MIDKEAGRLKKWAIFFVVKIRGGKTMNNIAIVKGDGEWGVLFNANNQPTSWRKITGYKNKMVIFEDFGQYPERLVLVFDSAEGAQEGFEILGTLAAQSLWMACEGF
ncbi:MAG: hypothetical protein ACD_7C00018G0002 [uncultured bacterium]|nr:MAG: hypothetical protein ACD_7C00018G0002 [uncultured bacterium]HBR79577.1 hypothetical protein [Candidatus Moranbacteria bacterium]